MYYINKKNNKININLLFGDAAVMCKSKNYVVTIIEWLENDNYIVTFYALPKQPCWHIVGSLGKLLGRTELGKGLEMVGTETHLFSSVSQLDSWFGWAIFGALLENDSLAKGTTINTFLTVGQRGPKISQQTASVRPIILCYLDS